MNTQPMRGGMVIQNHDQDHAMQTLRNHIKQQQQQQWESLTHPEPPMLPADLSDLAREIRRGIP